ncbi:hypothetical protein IAI18_09605 [Acetobacteraceae bacterium H6797]|nr:hypothetical protein [Acetobacteraceae bacterium H6797]
MRRSLALLLALALAACTATPPPPKNEPVADQPGMCRIGPDGGPPANAQLADRGIGGTGISAEGDRGIGGTGIIGVITGFASICVNGLEVEYDPSLLPPAPAHGLPPGPRVGQLVIIEAGGSADTLRARRIETRYEVSGPVEQLRGQEGLRVAGQEIRFAPGMAGEMVLQPGDWAAVSGLQQPDGRILATRIDRRQPGPITIHGVLRRDGDGLRLGALRLTPGLAAGFRAGQAVEALAHATGEAIVIDSIGPDLLLSDPAELFPPETERLVVESYITIGAGWMGLGTGEFRAAANGPYAPGMTRRAVLDARRQANGGFSATDLRNPGQAPGMRAMDGFGGAGRMGGHGDAGRDRAGRTGRMPGGARPMGGAPLQGGGGMQPGLEPVPNSPGPFLSPGGMPGGGGIGGGPGFPSR